MDFTIRAAEPTEYERLGEISVQAYLDDGLLVEGANDPYVVQLRDVAGRAAHSETLVAVDGDGTVLGGVSFLAGAGPWAQLAGPGEAEFRTLAVDPAARGRGVGEALVRYCLARARATEGCARVVLSTRETMHAAHRIYERLGFTRSPDRDWVPRPGVHLITYVLDLTREA